jgi:hypothetical protein
MLKFVSAITLEIVKRLVEYVWTDFQRQLTLSLLTKRGMPQLVQQVEVIDLAISGKAKTSPLNSCSEIDTCWLALRADNGFLPWYGPPSLFCSLSADKWSGNTLTAPGSGRGSQLMLQHLGATPS